MQERFEKFTYNIIKIYRAIQKIKALEVEEYGLKSYHVTIVYYLYINPQGLTSTQLVKYCDEDKAAISRSLKFLEDAKLLQVYKDDDTKAYRSPIVLTEDGKKVARIIEEKIDKVFSICGKGLTDEARKSFYEALELIANNMTQYANEGKE